MKPDKHKQKRTQQYKKKHGIKDDKDEKTQNKGKTQGPKSREQQGAHKGSAGLQAVGPPRQEKKASSGSEESEDEVVERSYRKQRGRNLPSNWERYEELPDDDSETITHRGADFSTLLQSSSSAVAQFRFADELAIEEDLSAAPQTQSFLTVDPHSLADAFKCIPLHQKLNVEDKYFEKKDIESFLQEAENHRKLYDEHRQVEQNKSETTDTLSQRITEQILSSDVGKNDEDLDLDSVVAISEQDVTNDRTSEAKPPKEIPNELLEDLDDILAGTEHQNVAERQLSIDTSGDQNDLGEIAAEVVQTNDSLNEQVKTEPSPVEQLNLNDENPQQKPVTNIEDELDNLLSLDDDEVTITKTSTKEEQSEQHGLEDWLDSMLED